MWIYRNNAVALSYAVAGEKTVCKVTSAGVDVLSSLQVEDKIVVCADRPLNSCTMIFSVLGTNELCKELEVRPGLLYGKLPKSVTAKIESRDSDLVQITDVEFVEIANSMSNSVFFHESKKIDVSNKSAVFQKILFGAPGTGKSYQLNLQANSFKRFSDWKLSFKEILEQYRTSGFNTCAYSSRIGNEFSIPLTYYLRDHSQEELAREFGLSSTEKDWIALSSRGATIGMNDEDVDNAVKCEGVERVTFHPNYSYAQFVGTYKPAQDKDLGHEKDIVYKYVPGPFMRTLVKALNNPQQDFLLIIEEINRANVAAVFGDVFQLLDRKNGVSEYPVAASEDIKRYLKDNGIADCNELKIPSNMYIWATMNSADQGVFPMDTAFKRRWEFEYIGINENETWDYTIPLPKNESINWNILRKAINSSLKKIASVNEDKLLGPYFLSKAVLEDANKWNSEPDSEEKQKAVEKFLNIFKSKVLMYLYEDVCKMRPGEVFKIKPEDGQTRLHYSDICAAFDNTGIGIFGFEKADIVEKYQQKKDN